jgi:hypothetical protein
MLIVVLGGDRARFQLFGDTVNTGMYPYRVLVPWKHWIELTKFSVPYDSS